MNWQNYQHLKCEWSLHISTLQFLIKKLVIDSPPFTLLLTLFHSQYSIATISCFSNILCHTAIPPCIRLLDTSYMKNTSGQNDKSFIGGVNRSSIFLPSESWIGIGFSCLTWKAGSCSFNCCCILRLFFKLLRKYCKKITFKKELAMSDNFTLFF